MASEFSQGIIKRPVVSDDLPDEDESTDLDDEVIDPLDDLVSGAAPEDEVKDNPPEPEEPEPTVQPQPPPPKRPRGRPKKQIFPSNPNMPMNGTSPSYAAPPTPQEEMSNTAASPSSVLSLRDWLSAHSLQSGLKWAKLIRLHPVEVINRNKPISVSGIQQDKIYHAFDENWIARAWGGASWSIEVWQHNTSKHRDEMIDHRVVSISGDPLAYSVGGRRMSIDLEDEEDMDDPPMPGRFGQNGHGQQAWGQRPGWGGQPGLGQMPFGAQPSPIVDLTRDLISAQRRQKEDVDFARMMKETAETAAKSQVDTLKEQLENLRRQSQENAISAARPAELIAETAKHNLSVQVNALTQQIEAERGLRARESEAMRNDHARQIQSLQNEATRNLEVIKGSYEMQLRVASDSVRAAEARALAAEERVSREIDRERTTWQREIDRERQDRDRDLTRAKESTDSQVKQIEGQLAARLDTANHEIARLQAELTAMRSDNLTLREKANPDMLTKMREVQQMIEMSQDITGNEKGEGDEEAEANKPAWERFLGTIAKSSIAEGMAERLRGPRPGPMPPMPGQMQIAPMPQVMAPPMPPQFGQPAPSALPPGFMPTPQQPAPDFTVPPAPQAPMPGQAAGESAEAAEDAARIAALSQTLAPALPTLEQLMVAGTDANAYADTLIQAMSKEDLEDFLENDAEDVIEAIEQINPNSPLCSAAGTRFIRTMYRRIEKAAGA